MTREQIQTIDAILASGCDVEIRKLKKGITIASVSKKLVYKEIAPCDGEQGQGLKGEATKE